MQQRYAEVLRAVPASVSMAWTNQTPCPRRAGTWASRSTPKQAETSSNTAMYFGPDSMVKTFGLKLIEGRDFTADDVDVIDPDKTQRTGPRRDHAQALAKKLYPERKRGRQDDVHRHRRRCAAVPGGRRGRAAAVRPGRKRASAANCPPSWRPRRVQGYSMFAVRTEPGQRDRVHEGSRGGRRQDRCRASIVVENNDHGPGPLRHLPQRPRHLLDADRGDACCCCW